MGVRWKNPDQEYRGCTIHCYYFLHDAEEYATRPGEWSFAPEFKELWQVMEQINKKIAREGSTPSWLKEHLE